MSQIIRWFSKWSEGNRCKSVEVVWSQQGQVEDDFSRGSSWNVEPGNEWMYYWLKGLEASFDKGNWFSYYLLNYNFNKNKQIIVMTWKVQN